jgi:hypothetical protein
VSFKIEITQVQWKVKPWHTWQGHSTDVNHTKSHNPEHGSSCSLCLCHDHEHLLKLSGVLGINGTYVPLLTIPWIQKRK